MRIEIVTTRNKKPVQPDHTHLLVGTINKWLGENDLHGKLGMYSFSQLKGARKEGDWLDFPEGAELFISIHEYKYIQTICDRIFDERGMFKGLMVNNLKITKCPDLSEVEYFKCASPIFIKRNIDRNNYHFTFNDREAGILMTEIVHHKMEKAGLEPDDSLRIDFDLSYSFKRTFLSEYKGSYNMVSVCPVLIKGKTSTKEFIWDVGLGNSTQIGYGSVFV